MATLTVDSDGYIGRKEGRLGFVSPLVRIQLWIRCVAEDTTIVDTPSKTVVIRVVVSWCDAPSGLFRIPDDGKLYELTTREVSDVVPFLESGTDRVLDLQFEVVDLSTLLVQLITLLVKLPVTTGHQKMLIGRLVKIVIVGCPIFDDRHVSDRSKRSRHADFPIRRSDRRMAGGAHFPADVAVNGLLLGGSDQARQTQDSRHQHR
jgi:hypothetical protein